MNQSEPVCRHLRLVSRCVSILHELRVRPVDRFAYLKRADERARKFDDAHSRSLCGSIVPVAVEFDLQLIPISERCCFSLGRTPRFLDFQQSLFSQLRPPAFYRELQHFNLETAPDEADRETII